MKLSTSKSQAMRRWRQNLTSFCQNTTIHGVRDVHDAKGLLRKLVLACVLLSFMFYFVCSMIKICLTYAEGPIVSSIHSEPPDSFPNTTICPLFWQDPEKVAYLNFSELEILYINSFFYQSQIITVMVGEELYSKRNSTARNESMEDAVESVKKRMEANNLDIVGVAEMILNHELVSNSKSLDSSDQATWRKTLWSFLGRCYTITAKSDIVKFQPGLNKIVFDVNDLTPRTGYKIAEFCTECSDGGGYETMIFDLSRKKLIIALSRTRIVRQKDCRSYEAGGQALCSMQCLMNACILPNSPEKVNEINAYTIENAVNRFTIKSAVWSNHTACVRTPEIIATCEKQCVKACQEDIYQVTVSVFGGQRRKDDNATVFVHLVDLNRWLVVTEKSLFDTMELISGIGATASLFFGASLWSLVHLIVTLYDVIVVGLSGLFRRRDLTT